MNHTAITSPSSSLPTLPPWKEDASVIGLVGLAHATSHFSHLLLAPLFPVFMREFGLSFADVGLLMTLFFFISGSGQALAGFVVDRIGARPVLLGAMGLFLLAALVASQASGYPSLMLVAALAGLGNAPFHPADFTILNQRVSPSRLGHGFSVHGLTGNLGWALAPAFLVGISALSHWRTAYWCAAGLYATVLAILWWQRHRLLTTVVQRSPGAQTGSDLAYLKLPVVWWCFAFFLLSTMTLAVIQNFAPSILEKVHGVSITTATLTVSAYMVCGAVGMALGGFVAHSGARSHAVIGLSLTAAAALLALCATGLLGAFWTPVVLASTGLAVGLAGPSRDMLIKRATPRGATGRVYGTVYSGLDVGFAIAPLFFGWLMDHGHYASTLAAASLTLMFAVTAAVAVGKQSTAP